MKCGRVCICVQRLLRFLDKRHTWKLSYIFVMSCTYTFHLNLRCYLSVIVYRLSSFYLSSIFYRSISIYLSIICLSNLPHIHIQTPFWDINFIYLNSRKQCYQSQVKRRINKRLFKINFFIQKQFKTYRKVARIVQKPHSNFSNGQNNKLYRKGFNSGSHFISIYHISLAFFDMEQFLCVSLIFVTLMFK